MFFRADDGVVGVELWTHTAARSGINRTITYDYDGLQRLTGASETAGNVYTYTYDLVGNRTSVTENGITTTRAYSPTNQVMGWSYDAAGNLLSDGTTNSTYDALNRLTARDGVSYTYNGDGVLVQTGATAYTQDLIAPLSQVLHDGSTSYVYGADAAAASCVATRR